MLAAILRTISAVTKFTPKENIFKFYKQITFIIKKIYFAHSQFDF